jgi:heterodisulfide reductase subunit A-like polyferredoxin
MMAEIKTAAYICSGCGLGDKLDVAQLGKIAQKEGKMALVREHDFLCNSAGVQMIRDDIEKEAVTHICIAACSRRSKTEAFNFPTVAMTRANLREGVVWVVAEGSEHDEVRQEMADDYVRMGCAELKKVKLPEGNPNTTHLKNILVVGGGMSCQLCQANVEIYQSEINKKKGTKLAMPVVYYSQLMAVAYGSSLKEAGLDGHVIQPERLKKIAERKK